MRRNGYLPSHVNYPPTRILKINEWEANLLLDALDLEDIKEGFPIQNRVAKNLKKRIRESIKRKK